MLPFPRRLGWEWTTRLTLPFHYANPVARAVFWGIRDSTISIWRINSKLASSSGQIRGSCRTIAKMLFKSKGEMR
jgi:hypothetical protein